MSGISVIGKGSSELNPTEEAVGERKWKKKTHSHFKFVKNVDIKKIFCKD